MKPSRRLTAVVSTSALLAGALVGLGAGTANAAPNVTFDTWTNSNGRHITVYADGQTAGGGDWFKDPVGSEPGDTLSATDSLGDGYHIESNLSTGRNVSTAGHPAPYSAYKGGNLTEGNSYTMWTCIVKGTWYRCSAKYSVTS